MTLPSNFDSLSLPREIHSALRELQFTTPTPIQAAAIPVALTGRDVIGCAQTGTGKTAAFGIPLVTFLSKTPNRTALVLVPTRELAAQVVEVVRMLSKFLPQMQSAILIGGAAMQPQVRALQKNPRIIVATPGRLLDHLRSRRTLLSNVGILVLDEADRMLDMGFAPQLNEIIRNLPPVRQTMMFTATFPKEIEQIAARLLRNPERVSVGPTSVAAPKIEQSVVQTTPKEKGGALLDQLEARKGSVIIFARTQTRTDRVARMLSEYGHNVVRLHGGRTQGQRTAAIKSFRAGDVRILVATDIAARGLDISHVAHVINFDLPQVPEDYIHRIGRTARAGAGGEALSFLTAEDRPMWQRISKLLGRRATT